MSQTSSLIEKIHRGEEGPFLQWVIGGLLSGLLAMVWVVYANLDGDLSQVSDTQAKVLQRLETKQGELIRLGSSLVAFQREMDWWQEKVASIEDSLVKLATDAGARKDPFTGTEGAVLTERVAQLNRLHYELRKEYMRHKVDEREFQTRVLEHLRIDEATWTDHFHEEITTDK